MMVNLLKSCKKNNDDTAAMFSKTDKHFEALRQSLAENKNICENTSVKLSDDSGSVKTNCLEPNLTGLIVLKKQGQPLSKNANHLAMAIVIVVVIMVVISAVAIMIKIISGINHNHLLRLIRETK